MACAKLVFVNLSEIGGQDAVEVRMQAGELGPLLQTKQRRVGAKAC